MKTGRRSMCRFIIRLFPFVVIVVVIVLTYCYLLSGLNKGQDEPKLSRRNEVIEAISYRRDFFELEIENETSGNIRNITSCIDIPQRREWRQNGIYWVLYNYIPSSKSFSCGESVTFTTYGDYSSLYNLVPLVERWRGPISVALYVLEGDYRSTLDSIVYLRLCTTKLIKEMVSFHLFFRADHVVAQDSKFINMDYYNCAQEPSFFLRGHTETMRYKQSFVYPVNVARNIAREGAQTYFMLFSSIEFYPSPNFIPKFLKMVEDFPKLTTDERRIYALNAFEIDDEMPNNKSSLKQMIWKGTATPFWFYNCPTCREPPYATTKWLRVNETEGMDIFSVDEDIDEYRNWEFYIYTQEDPWFDERIVMQKDYYRIAEAYTLCLLRYTRLVLDNAFLVRRHGVKTLEPIEKDEAANKEAEETIYNNIYNDWVKLYGQREICKGAFLLNGTKELE